MGLERVHRFVVVRDEQFLLTEAALRFRSAVEYDGGVAGPACCARTRGPADVVMDPRRAFGQPAVRHVPTASFAEDYRAGTSRDELADLDDLTLDQVDEPIRFELIAGAERMA